MTYEEEILSFITHFSDYGEEVIDCFTTGNCYWFALILHKRFGGEIMYNPILCHFACRLNGGHLYDITGRIDNVVTGPWENFDEMEYHDSAHYVRVLKNCVEFRE